MIITVTSGSSTVSTSCEMATRLIPAAQTVLGEFTTAERLRAVEPGGHPWTVRARLAA